MRRQIDPPAVRLPFPVRPGLLRLEDFLEHLLFLFSQLRFALHLPTVQPRLLVHEVKLIVAELVRLAPVHLDPQQAQHLSE